MGARAFSWFFTWDRQFPQPDPVSSWVLSCPGSCFAAASLDQIHRSHAAHVVRIAHQFAAWGVQADFAAVSPHSAAIGLSSFRLSWSVFVALIVWGIVIDAVVVLTQHRQIRRFRVSAVFVSVDVVHLASIGRNIAVWPWAHKVLCHGESAKFV